MNAIDVQVVEAANTRLVDVLRAGQKAILEEMRRQGAEEYTSDEPFGCDDKLPPHFHLPIVGVCELLVRAEDQEPLAVVTVNEQGESELHYKPHLMKGGLHG